MEHGHLLSCASGGAALAALDELGEHGGAALAGVGGGEESRRALRYKAMCCDKPMLARSTALSDMSRAPVLCGSVLNCRQGIGFNQLTDDLRPARGDATGCRECLHVQ